MRRDKLSVVLTETIKAWPGFWLRADVEGLTMRYPLGKSRYRWQDIDGDFVVSGRYVGFRLASAARTSLARRVLGWFQRSLIGCDAAIQASSYRMSAEGLKVWLQRQRQAALEQQ
jgi:hypothetical protein